MNDSYDAEYEDHARMWRDFTRMTTGGIIVVILVLVGMAAVLV